MELPTDLRQAGEQLLTHISIDTLSQASQRLSKRYRAELRDNHLHLDTMMAAKAYIAARLPATFAAAFKALEAASNVLGNFSPQTLLDAGAGPGSVFFAAREVFDTLNTIALYEKSNDIQQIGEQLCQKTIKPAQHIKWCHGDLTQQSTVDTMPMSDLVTLGFVLNELHEEQQDKLIDGLWKKCQGAMVIIEPGTPAGWKRILRQRDFLKNQGAFIAAPCPHSTICPLILTNTRQDIQHQEDWCHFSVRLARSKLHRLTKQADVPYEDEKFCYLVASRFPPQPIEARILSHPQKSSGRFSFKLCSDKGTLETRQITRRDGDIFKQARRLNWGDALNNHK